MSGEGVFFCVKFWAECVTLTPLSCRPARPVAVRCSPVDTRRRSLWISAFALSMAVVQAAYLVMQLTGTFGTRHAQPSRAPQGPCRCSGTNSWL